jgi:IS30 family transposase
MSYRQLTSGERYMLAALRKQGLNQAQIGRALGRHRSTISRELCRNSSGSAPTTAPAKLRSALTGGAHAHAATYASAHNETSIQAVGWNPS